MVDMLNNDYLAQPFEDELMTYNYQEHRYVLTVDGALSSNLDMVLVFNGEQNLKEYLDLLSRSVYTALLKNKDSKYYYPTLITYSHSKHYRASILKIFLDTIWYNFRSGGFMVAYQSGINLNEMKQLKIDIDTALSVFGNEMANIFGINERVLRQPIVKNIYCKTIDEVKAYLIDKGFKTQEELEDKDTLEDIGNTNQYSLFYEVFLIELGKYLIVDKTLFNELMQQIGKEW